MTAIFTRLLEEIKQGHDTVLVTIIRRSGSTPRGTGAQMLAGAGGLLCGTIGGGSVEGNSIVLAQALLREKRSTVQDYHLRYDAPETVGMVCGGDVTVHLQYIAARDDRWNALAHRVLQSIADRQNAKLLLDLNGGTPDLVSPDTAVPEGKFALPLPIGERAIIFGAGHCSVALSPILQTIGFRVTVMDDRKELADPVRFPGADAVLCGDYAHLSDSLTVTEDDYVVVMTSGHTHDFTVEEQLLRGKVAYLGVIGSHNKTAAVNKLLREAGISESAIASVHTPIGIPIQAVTPEEIAISIAGEMIQVRAEHREKQGGTRPHGCPMHE